MSKKLVYLALSGELYRLADGDIANLGGTSFPTFLVNNKPLLFADGTSTDGSSGNALSITLQDAYDKSLTGQIDLSSAKDFVVNALNNNQIRVDATTGKVTITGDLEVQGASTIIEGTVSNLDQVNIAPPVGTQAALNIEPRPGVTLTTNLVRFRLANGGPDVLTIDQNGVTHLTALEVSGLINGVDLSALNTTVAQHVALTGTSIRHKALQISVDGPFANFVGTNVEEILHSVDDIITNAGGSTVLNYQHLQASPALTWTIVHNRNSLSPTTTIFGPDSKQVFPDEVVIVNSNTVEVHFASPQSGRAIILLF